MSNEIQASDRTRFELLKKTVSDGLAICYIVGSALREIKEREFYLADGFSSFEVFCEAKWGWTKRHCNKLIVDANAINSLPVPMRKLITSHRAAEELSKVDSILRPTIVEKIIESGKKVTPAEIKKAIPPRKKGEVAKLVHPTKIPDRKKGKAEPKVLDATGVEVPRECLSLWNRREEAQEILSYLSAIRGSVKKANDIGDILFVECDFMDTLAHLNQAYVDMERAKPYAICPTCQGKLPKGCLSCKGRGFVSEFYWKHSVPEETRNLRKI